MMNRVYSYRPRDLTATDLEAVEIELTERLTRRRFIIGAGGLLGAAALGACGAGEEATTPTATVAETRILTHALGETEVPVNPQRVVTLQDQNALLPLFELGFTDMVGSIGVVGEDGNPFFRRMQAYDTTDVAYIGEYGSPNLEQIAELQPDLIVGNEFEITTDNYDLLSEIAPTVIVTRGSRPVNEVMQDYAVLVNRVAVLDELEARYQERITEVRKARVTSPFATVALVIFMEDGNFLVESSGAPTQVLQDLGFAFTAAQQAVIDSGERGTFSIELLPEYDADLLLWPYFGSPENDRAQELRRSELWQQLRAVQNGQAHSFAAARWYGAAYQALFFALDDLELIFEGI